MKVEIEKTEDRWWVVRCGERWEDNLDTGEALYLVSVLLINGPDAAPHLRTAEEHEARRLRYGPYTPAELQVHQKLLVDQREAKNAEADAIFPNVKV